MKIPFFKPLLVAGALVIAWNCSDEAAITVPTTPQGAEQFAAVLRRLRAFPQKLQRHQATTLHTTGRIRLRIAFDQQFANASGGVTYFELEQRHISPNL